MRAALQIWCLEIAGFEAVKLQEEALSMSIEIQKNTDSDYSAKLRASYSFIDNAIFIFGAGRSGTTLLHSLLDSHPEIVAWPFEFSYYPEYERFRKRKKLSRSEPVEIRKLNKHFLARDDIQSLGGKYHYSMGVFVNLANVKKDVFFDVMYSQPGDMLVYRKDYLLLLITAYYEAFCPEKDIKAFLYCIQNIRDEAIDDFPNAKYLWAYREPIENYIAIKTFYFNSTENKFLRYFPRSCNSTFRHGLLEVAFWPVYFTSKWVLDHKEFIDLFTVDLRDLQKNTIDTLRKLTDFLDIAYCQSLEEATFAGVRFDSNISSGLRSKGNVVETVCYDPIRELSVFEYYYISSKLTQITKKGYPKRSGIPWRHFFSLLKNEFPSAIIKRKKKTPGVIRLIITLIAFILIYLNNRVFFLFSQIPSENPWE